LRVGKEHVRVTTDASGTATATLTIDQRAGDAPASVSVSAQFDGDGDYLAIEALRNSVRIVKESTSIRWLEEAGPAGRQHRALAAQLLDDDGHPVSKRLVAFTVGSKDRAEKCAALTDGNGVARCKISSRTVETVAIFFPGDTCYESATGSGASATTSIGIARARR
jgi:hypothetical protein